MQLLSVMPPNSADLLPKAYQKLMLESSSPIQKFYPDDFYVDLNGKQNAWEAIALIPFIDTDELIKAVSKIDHKMELTTEERLRNILGTSKVFTGPRKGNRHDSSKNTGKQKKKQERNRESIASESIIDEETIDNSIEACE